MRLNTRVSVRLGGFGETLDKMLEQKFAGLLPSYVTIQCQLYRDMLVLEGCRVAEQLYCNTPKCIARVCSGWKCIAAWGKLESCIAIRKIVLQLWCVVARETVFQYSSLYCKRKARKLSHNTPFVS